MSDENATDRAKHQSLFSGWFSRHHWKRWCLLAMVAAVSLLIPAGWRLRVRDFNLNFRQDQRFVTGNDRSSPSIFLKASLSSIDMTSEIVPVEWTMTYVCYNPDPTNKTCIDFKIYDYLAYTSRTHIPKTPVFIVKRVNATTPANVNSFNTSTTISSDGRIDSYPLDVYRIAYDLYAFDFAGNEVPLKLSWISGIVPIGFSWYLEYHESDTHFHPNIVQVGLRFSRNWAVICYIFIIIMAIWLVTLVVLSSFIFSVILGRKLPKEVLLVPTTTLFAFTQLRGTFPGAPTDFGLLIDFVGILPCLGLLSFCSIGMLAIFLFRNPEVNRGEDEDDSRMRVEEHPLADLRASLQRVA